MIPYPTEISPEVELVSNVQYGCADGVELRLDIARPKTRETGRLLPAIVYMHGGAWQSGSKEDGVPAICYYAQHGFVAASVGYRLSDVARFPAQIEDCKCAVRFLRANAVEYGIDPGRIGAMGVSSGAHLAMLLGLTEDGMFAGKGGWEDYSSKISAVCDLFGPVDFSTMPKKTLPHAVSATVQLFGGTIEEMRDRYVAASPVTYVHKAAPPFLIVHGELDPIIPVQQSELMRDTLEKEGVDVEYHLVKGAGHGSREVMTPEVREWIVRFFKKWLEKESQTL